MKILLVLVFAALTGVHPVTAADLSFTGSAQSRDTWRIASGYRSPDIKLDWFRQTEQPRIISGYNITVSHVVSRIKTQYQQIYRTDRKSIREVSSMCTLWGIGLGAARSWIGGWENPKWMAKAQFAIERKTFSVCADWASSFAGRKTWGVSPRLKIPGWKRLGFTLGGRWQGMEDSGRVERSWGVEGGLSMEVGS